MDRIGGPHLARSVLAAAKRDLLIGAGLAVTGLLLALILGMQLLTQPWLLLALAAARPGVLRRQPGDRLLRPAPRAGTLAAPPAGSQ